MSRNPLAGHRGAQGKPSRCHECRHRRGRRVTVYSRAGAEPREHKKPCSCRCHQENVVLEETERLAGVES